MKWETITQNVVAGVALAAIIGVFFTLKPDVARHEAQISRLSTDLQELRSQITTLSRDVQALSAQLTVAAEHSPPIATPNRVPAETSLPNQEEIPLTAAWKSQGPGAIGGGPRGGELVLEARLKGGDDYAELFLDLRDVRLRGINVNSDGTYDLSGMEIVAVARCDKDFSGDPSKPNGAQFLLKDQNWSNLVGTWLHTNALTSEHGMEIFYRVPNHPIARSVAGISIKFTTGSRSSAAFDGTFRVQQVFVRRGR